MMKVDVFYAFFVSRAWPEGLKTLVLGQLISFEGHG